jgi:predicted HicB family RNase H-like nuclease
MANQTSRTERLTVRIPNAMLAQLRARAEREGVSVASLIIAAIATNHGAPEKPAG